MKKKILSVVAILALTAVLAVALVACSPSSYEKKLTDNGYSVTVNEEDSSAVKSANKALELDGGFEGKITWIVTGTKLSISLSGADAGLVNVYKFEKSADAKRFVEKNGGEGDGIVAKGSIVIAGDKASVELLK